MEGTNAYLPAVRRCAQGDRWALGKENARQRWALGLDAPHLHRVGCCGCTRASALTIDTRSTSAGGFGDGAF